MTRLLALAALVAAACANPQPCPQPLVECNGRCIDVQSNPSDCGACGSACAAGEVCVGASCTRNVNGPCPDRTDGAFVTLGVCGSTVKLWIRAPAFIDESASYVGTTATPRTPALALVAGSDCDPQWSWHVDDASPTWVPTVSGGCTSACPDAIEAAVHANALPSPIWCPIPSIGLVLAVDRRPIP